MQGSREMVLTYDKLFLISKYIWCQDWAECLRD